MDAIAAGKVAPAQTPNLAPGAQQQDQSALLKLGQMLRPPGALTPDEAFVMYWLLLEANISDDHKTICDALKGIPPANNPCKSDKYITGWTLESQVRTELQGFSPATQSGFKARVKAERDRKQKASIQRQSYSRLPVSSLPAIGPIPQSIRIEVLR